MDLRPSKHQFFGQYEYSPKKLIRNLQEHPDILQALEDYPAENRKIRFNQSTLQSYLNEIVATPSKKVVDGMRRTLGLLWYRIFNGIEIQGLDELKSKIAGKRVIYLPCHRSHLDYLLISFVLNSNGMNLPHIIAGNNLNIAGVGRILKGGGAVFMRRSFQDKPLYGAALRTYLHYLLEHKFPLEVFIEGGRSRTGKNLPPKTGVLGMLMDYMLANADSDLQLVPISIAYERIPEEKTYIKELAGEAKKKENIFELLNSYKVLKKNFGKVFVSFAPPMSLREMHERYLEENQMPISPTAESTEYKSMLYSFGMDVMDQINTHMRISAVPLVATALLSERHMGFHKDDLLQKSQFLLDVYQEVHPRAQDTLVESKEGLKGTIEFFIESGLVSRWRDSTEDIYYFNSRNKVRLNLYKNIFVHHFVIPSVIALKLKQGPQSRESLLQDICFFERLLRYEFMFPRSYDFTEALDTMLNFSQAKGLIRKEEGGNYIICNEKEKEIRMLSRIILPFLDSFHVAIDVLLSEKVTFPLFQKKLVEVFRAGHQKLLLLGKIESLEGNLTVSYHNIIHFLIDEKILEVERDNNRNLVMRKGNHFEKLIKLRDSL